MRDIGRIGIVPATYYWWGSGDRIGSTYVRMFPIVARNRDFELWVHGRKYDSLVFQQFFWQEFMKVFEGPKILDISDPDWLQTDLEIVEIGNLVHAITCSSEELTRLVRTYFPNKMVEHVPDRLDFTILPPSRVPHSGEARKVVWFGYTHNAHEVLAQLAPSLKECDLSLTLISDVPYSKEDDILSLHPDWIPYDRRTVYNHIREADIMLNPRSERAYFRYKSNNKSLVGWRLGLPVAVTSEDLLRLMDPNERNKEVATQQPIVERDYNIDLTGSQYREIFVKILSDSSWILPLSAV